MRHVAIITAGAGLFWIGQASAHAFMATASPGVGATVPTAPTQVLIGFTEAVKPLLSRIEVTNVSGARVDDNTVGLVGNGRHLAVGLMKLAPGTYRVVWHATDDDQHKTQGKYSFTVAP